MPDVVDLTHEDLPAAGEVMALAFQDDPALRFFLPGEGEKRMGKLRVFAQAMGAARLARGQILKGIKENGRLVALLSGAQPEGGEENAESEAIWERCFDEIGRDVEERLMQYGRVQMNAKRPGKCYYVIALATHPAHQRRGFGAALLREVERMAEGTDGVSLDTATESNVRWYESQGYRVHEHVLIEGRDLWMMHRHPNGPQPRPNGAVP